MDTSLFDGEYRGYEVRLRVDRRGEAEPYLARGTRDVFELMRSLAKESAERVYTVNVDGGYKVMGVYLVGKGGSEWAPVDHREVYKAALLTNASAFYLVHNHPCGDATPSMADKRLVSRIRKGAPLLGLEFLDSVIIGQYAFTSFRDLGLLPEEDMPF